MQILCIFYICDEIVKQVGFRDHPHAKMSTSQVLTVFIVAAKFFCGNQESARRFLQEHGYINNMLGKSRFNRRLHAIPLHIFEVIIAAIGEIHKLSNPENEYMIDSFPVAVCQNIRIWHSRIYRGEEYRGYCSSKKQYFYGLKVHMIVTKDGKPIEFTFTPGSHSDIATFKKMRIDLKPESIIYGDKAYNDYSHEDIVNEAANIKIISQRKNNSKRQWSTALNYVLSKTRKRIETTFSCITQLFPKTIHAVTATGFELKLASFILAYSINFLLPD